MRRKTVREARARVLSDRLAQRAIAEFIAWRAENDPHAEYERDMDSPIGRFAAKRHGRFGNERPRR
jgi:hypothetical protein